MTKTIVATMLGLTIVLGGCTDEFFAAPPKGQANEEILKNKAGIEKLLLGAYAVVDGVNGSTGSGWASADMNWVWGGVASDDAYKGTVSGDQNPINDIEGFYVSADNSYVADHWEPFYDGILRVNDILRLLPEVADMTDEEVTLVEAQAKFLRAHYYVELTRVHGPVPYIDENTENPGAVPNDHYVWSEIEADFEFAIANLPPDWNDHGRATSWAAKTYLGYVHLTQHDYAAAKPLFEDVLNSGPFSLMPSYEQNYLIAHNNNAESIFEIQYAVNDGQGQSNAGLGNSIIGGTFMGGSCFYQPTHNLVQSYRTGEDGLPLLDDIYDYTVDDILPFDDADNGAANLYTEPVDPRLDHTVGRPGVPFLDWGVQAGLSWIRDPSNGGPYLNKKPMFLEAEKGTESSVEGRTFPNANNYRKFKLGQVILWLAEIEVETGDLERARELVNMIRNRAKESNVVLMPDGTPASNYVIEPYPSFPSREYARLAYQHEMRVEYAMEGYRFYDLVRWGIAEEYIDRHFEADGTQLAYLLGRDFVSGQHEIWPIPQLQIDLSRDENGNPVLEQNPGY